MNISQDGDSLDGDYVDGDSQESDSHDHDPQGDVTLVILCAPMLSPG